MQRAEYPQTERDRTNVEDTSPRRTPIDYGPREGAAIIAARIHGRRLPDAVYLPNDPRVPALK